MNCKELGIKEIEITWGSEKFSPISYHFVDVGPITIKIVPNPNETFEDAYSRGYKIVNDYGCKQVELKVKGFLERIKLVAAAVESARVK